MNILVIILAATLFPLVAFAEVRVSISGGEKIKDGDSGGQYVVAVDAEVKIPFDEEYKINLDNKDTSRRALVHVKIDGRAATGEGLVLRKGESVALERFIGDDLGRGAKFKFVDIDERDRMGRKGTKRDGLVAVTVQYEKDTEPLVKYEQRRDYATTGTSSNVIIGGPAWSLKPGCGGSPGQITTTESCMSYTTDATASVLIAGVVTSSSAILEPGVTVEGSESKQRFKETKLGELENRVETLVIRLLGYYKTAPLLMRQR